MISEDKISHIPVLLKETIDGLSIKANGIYVDGTVGLGGHSKEIVSRLTSGKLIGFDLDPEAIKITRNKLHMFEDKIILVQDDYKNIIKYLDSLNIREIDGVLLDLGVSSMQIDDPDRGFSYTNDGKIDMRMDQTKGISAYEILRDAPFEEMAKIFREYGEENYAGKIAARIIAERKDKEIETTYELAELVKSCYPSNYRDGNPAKRVFQALRIEVNQELSGLYDFILSVSLRLRSQGRIAVISFHSLEDRIIKKAFNYLEKDCICDKKSPICTCNKRREISIITSKPIVASSEEITINRRAKSAKLRIAERI
ncbi:MAG: Ribosomal RNA small subunit methyltransferase H [Firmicutes bacterium ADurb.Bin080]|jgi:16S rRNA (cytosine1402-N4)-methyltransferase|nr:16S rRNA (cytosine(1402)-N(4))-methyltransferase RsmH [Clostridiales bacterium]OQC16505.1 MAG: Ribosomal RNA small subunit methyltransferase H [Firmicutes bacterium ADurb.Bin080]